MTPSPAAPRRFAATFSVCLCLLVPLSACGDDGAEVTPEAEPTPDVTTSQATEEPPKKTSDSEAGATLAIEVAGDDISPSGKTITMSVGDTLTIRVVSDRAGELHVHSSPEQSVEFKAGETRRDLTIDKPGQVDIEEHDSDKLVARLLVQ